MRYDFFLSTPVHHRQENLLVPGSPQPYRHQTGSPQHQPNTGQQIQPHFNVLQQMKCVSYVLQKPSLFVQKTFSAPYFVFG